jgi:glyoxylase-like metal-dependent hydrolase (beta-lactamase superfamily II)
MTEQRTLDQFVFGDCRVTRLPDLEDFPMPADLMYPDATREALARLAPRFGPRFIDAAAFSVLLSFHTWLVRTPTRTILVDTCIGNDKTRERYDAWNRRRGPYLERLAAAGVRPEDVDCVMCTHLHADHVGWNTRLVDGRWVPTFPNAEYVMHEVEYRHYLALHEAGPETPVNYGSFLDSVLPVVERGQARLVAGDHRVEAGVYLEPAPGHTPGNVLIHLERDARHAIFCGDVLHHPIQLAHPEWSTRFCFDAAASRRMRRGLLERVAGSDTRLMTAHFQTPGAGRIVEDGAAFGIDWG